MTHHPEPMGESKAVDHEVADVVPGRLIKSHRRPKPWEVGRDREVLRLLFEEFGRLPEPRPDLPTWLSGATTALLLIRQVSS